MTIFYTPAEMLLKAAFQSINFTPLRKKPYENVVGKGGNTDNQHFFLFHTAFSILFWVKFVSTPNDKISDLVLSKFKTSADDKLKMTDYLKFVLGMYIEKPL